MDKIAKLLIVLGGTVAVVAGCSLDTYGAFGYIAGAVGIAGAIIAVAGYKLMILAEKRKEQDMKFYILRQMSRENEDTEWMKEAK